MKIAKMTNRIADWVLDAKAGKRGKIQWLIFIVLAMAVFVGWFGFWSWFGFRILHDVIPAIPALGFWDSLAAVVGLSLILKFPLSDLDRKLSKK